MSDALTFPSDTYQTTPDRAWTLFRTLPSFFFYCQDAFIVVKASRVAKRGQYDTATWVASSGSIIRALERVGIRFDITGIDHLRNLTAPAVIIGNHMSTLETFVLPALLATFRETTFVVKQSLVEYPFFGHVMRSRNPVTVTRDNPREDLRAVLEGGEQRLQAGISMVVFPQTTRTTVFDPREFNSIGVKLAKKAGAPIIPLALKTDAWANGKYLKDFGRIRPKSTVHFAFGEPLTVSGRGHEEHDAIVRFISDKLTAWNRSQDGGP